MFESVWFGVLGLAVSFTLVLFCIVVSMRGRGPASHLFYALGFVNLIGCMFWAAGIVARI